MSAIVQPSTSETAFNCPHCGAFATQHWYGLSATAMEDEHRTPVIPGTDLKEKVERDQTIDAETRLMLIEWVRKMSAGLVYFERSQNGRYVYKDASNLFISECFNCKKIAVWVHEKLIFPPYRNSVSPNPDLPQEIIRDFEEARSILDLSPRGAAALLRLCIQKLCASLGEKGKNIDDDIASLVKKGLNPLVQKSLDVVRVVGNEAVHPGTIDLRDDRETAAQLLVLVNLVADQMISHPKAIEAMYAKLPEGKRKAIDQRDGKK